MVRKNRYINLVLMSVLVCTALQINSCKTKDDPKPAPSITREFPSKDTSEVDSAQVIDIKYQFNTASENIKLSKYQTICYIITTKTTKSVNYNFQSGRKLADSIVGGVNTYTFSESIKIADTVKQNQLYRVVTTIWDKQKVQATNIFYLKIKKTNIKTYFKDTNNVDRISNRAVKRNDCLFPSLPAYDLNIKTVLPDTASSQNIDMLNTTVVDTTAPNYANFSHGWKSLNATLFVKADTLTFKYEKATIEDAEREYLKGVPKNTISSVNKNEVYVIKLRGLSYMILKVTEVIDDYKTLKENGDNCDYIQFKFKKK